MKAIAFFVMLVLLGISTSRAADPIDCTQNSGGPTLIPIENPEDCGSYYVCANKTPVLMQCPKGLHFNNILKICDYPKNACCPSANLC